MNVTRVTIASPPVVEFTAANEDGVPYPRLESRHLRFALARLVPGEGGAPDHWLSLVNRTESPPAPGPAPNDWPSTAPQLQATTDSGGDLVNAGDGRYRYTFTSSVSDPVPEQTHRLVLAVGGSDRDGMALPAANVIHDWQPSTGATTGIRRHDIVATASCNECHGALAAHAGAFTDARACVACHTPESKDANSGHALGFEVLVHKLHQGRDLPSVKAGGRYVLWGEGDVRQDFGKVGFPQDIRNCTKCHDASDPETPQAGNWESVPSVEACGSCHDGVNLATGLGHGPQNIAAVNGACATCHDDVTAPSAAKAHASPLSAEAAKYAFRIVGVTLSADSSGMTAGFPVVTYAVTDPSHADAPYDLVDDADPVDAPWTGRHLESRLRIDIGWGATEYDNRDNGDASGRPADALWLNALKARRGFNAAPVDNGDGTYTVTSQVGVPLGIGTIAVAMEGYAAATTPDPHLTWGRRVPVKTAVTYMAVTDATPIARREVVDIAKCNQCHGQLTRHGNSRTDEPRACVICHNANNTDIARRPGDIDATDDGKDEEALDFKTLIHGIHAADFREPSLSVYGGHGFAHTYDADTVRFPGILSNCAACHVPGTSSLPLAAEVLGTTIDSGSLRTDAADDLNITATAAACSSCHTGPVARAHMNFNGASFDRTERDATFEVCSICHGPGRMFDVATVHSATTPPEQRATPAPHAAAPPTNWYPWCLQCHDRNLLAPEPTVESARDWMREMGVGFGQWVREGNDTLGNVRRRAAHAEADLGRCFDCHRPRLEAGGTMPCNFCHAYGPQAQEHQWLQAFAYPPGVDPTQPQACDSGCHNWVNTGDDNFDIVALGYLNASGDPEQTTYHGPLRPGHLMANGDKAHNDFFHASDGSGGCAFCHNRGADKTWHGRQPADPANPDGEFTTTIPNCVDCHNYDWGEVGEVNLHSTHATLVGAEMPLAYPDGYNRGVASCDLCHGGDEGRAACWNCHLSAHWPQVPYWKLPE